MSAGAELVYEPARTEQLDRLLYPRLKSEAENTNDMPKGIDALTLSKVRTLFDTTDAASFNAEEVGRQIGVSRSTRNNFV